MAGPVIVSLLIVLAAACAPAPAASPPAAAPPSNPSNPGSASAPPAPAPPAPAAAAPREPQTIRLAHAGSYSSWKLAQERGYFEEEALTIDDTIFDTSTRMLP